MAQKPVQLTVERMRKLLEGMKDNDRIGIVLDDLSGDDCTYAYKEHRSEENQGTYVIRKKEIGLSYDTLMLVMDPGKS